MEYNILTCEQHHEVILFAFNNTTGESLWMKFPKLSICADFCRRHNISVSLDECIERSTFSDIR